jgi:iron complex transport system ATP-binding protein
VSLALRNVMVGYRDAVVLRGVSIEARPGRITAVLGPNASGKSSLLRTVIGALRPRAGKVLIDDVTAHRLRGRMLAERVAYVPQRSLVSAAFTTRQVVELGRYALPMRPGIIDEAQISPIQRSQPGSSNGRPSRGRWRN